MAIKYKNVKAVIDLNFKLFRFWGLTIGFFSVSAGANSIIAVIFIIKSTLI